MIPRQGQLANLFLKVTDLALMFCALSLAIIVNYGPQNPQPVPAYAIDFFGSRIKVGNALLCALMVVVWYVVFNMQGIYRSHRLSTALDEFREIGRAVFLASVTLLVVAHIGSWPTITLATAASVGVTGFALIGGMRVLLRLNLRRL